jgi:hypothetical protein
MAKNRKYHVRYTLEFKGITTNEHMPNFLREFFNSILLGLRVKFKQMEVADLKEEVLHNADTEL